MRFQTHYRTALLASIGLLGVLLSGCSGIQIDRQEPDTFAAAGYSTYSWNYAPIKPLPNDKTAYPLISNIFRDEMNAALADLGYREVAEGGEFIVSTQIKESISDGVVSVSEQDEMFRTQAIINRDPDGASLDNAQALAGPRAVNNILIQFDDGENRSLLWAAVISKVIETANINELDPDDVRDAARQAIRRATSQLPEAPG